MFKLIKGQQCANSKCLPLGALIWLATASPDCCSQRHTKGAGGGGHVTGRECICTLPRLPSCYESREVKEGGWEQRLMKKGVEEGG